MHPLGKKLGGNQPDPLLPGNRAARAGPGTGGHHQIGKGILRVHSKRSHFVVGRGVGISGEQGGARDRGGGGGGSDSLLVDGQVRGQIDSQVGDSDEGLLEAVMNDLAATKPASHLYD